MLVRSERSGGRTRAEGDARSARRGATLLELLVVMIVTSIALTLITAIALRQQRLFVDLAEANALGGQLRDAASILPIDLRGASTAAGDFREARDTAIELRSVVASAVVCDTSPSALVLAPAPPGGGAFASASNNVQVGDTAWIYIPGDTTDRWLPYQVASTTAVAAGPCAPLAPLLSPDERLLARVAIGLRSAPSLANLVGAPLRVTRPVRYSLYHASDGAWYLGERDWNTLNARFNTIQPVSGPFLSPADGGLAIHYLDSLGVALPTPVIDAHRIASLSIDLRGQSRDPQRALGARASTGKRGEAATVVVSLRNRP